MTDKEEIQKALNILKRIQFQLQYTLSDLYKCGMNVNTMEHLLKTNVQKDNKKAPLTGSFFNLNFYRLFTPSTVNSYCNSNSCTNHRIVAHTDNTHHFYVSRN